LIFDQKQFCRFIEQFDLFVDYFLDQNTVAVTLIMKSKRIEMKTRTIMIILILAIIGVSCLPSLYPLYREKDLLFDDRLVGRFDIDDLWIIDSLDLNESFDQVHNWNKFNTGKTYRLQAYEDDKLAEFALHLIKLKDNYYLDFWPVTYTIKHDFLDVHLFPAHIFAKLEFVEENLVINWFDGGFLNDLIDSNKIKISHKELEYGLLLTARTNELQKFVKKYGDDPRAYLDAEDPDTLYRLPENNSNMASKID